MFRLSLRTQVVLIVSILALTAIGAVQYFRQATLSARETIVGLYRERLSSITADLGSRYGGVLRFVSATEWSDSTSDFPPSMKDVLATITRERLHGTEGIHAGIAIIPAGTILPLSDSTTTEIDAGREPLVRILIVISARDGRPEWSRHVLGTSNVLCASHPVMARNRLVAVAWAYDDVGVDARLAMPFPIDSVLQIIIVLAVALAMYLIITLRRELQQLLHGIHTMKQNAGFRLSASHSELGEIARSINELADTVTLQQQQRDEMQHNMQHQEKLASLGRLVAGVAHKIRTPLTSIKTRVQLWQRAQKKRGSPVDTTRAFTPASTELVVRELDRMEEAVRQLLYFAKHRKIRHRVFNLHDVILSVLANVTGSLKSRKIRVFRELHLDDPRIIGDPQELHEVITNLVTNAIDAMPAGGKLTLATEAGSEPDRVVLTVADTGTGIAADKAAHVFDPFFTTKEAGTGLGLSIAYEIIGAHRGSIRFSPAPGRGTVFTITLPRSSDQGTPHRSTDS